MSREIARKANEKSAVWNHFGVSEEVKNRKAVCLHCKRSVSARSRNTFNLFSHLRTNHPKQYQLASSTKKQRRTTNNTPPTTKPGYSQPAIAKSLSRSQRYDQNSKRWKQLTDLVNYCLAKDMLPMLLVKSRL